MSVDLTQFHDTYFEESFELLDQMEASFLEIQEESFDRDLIDCIFRAAHSIKGGAGTFGFQEINEFTHLCETLLDEVRSGTRELDSTSVNVLLEAVDIVRNMLVARRGGGVAEETSYVSVREELETILGAPAASSSEASDSEVEGGWQIRFRPHENLFHTGNDPVRIIKDLSRLGELEIEVDDSGVPDFQDLDPECCYLSWRLALRGSVTREQILESFDWVAEDCDLEIEPIDEATGAIDAADPANSPESPASTPAPAETPPKAEPAAASASPVKKATAPAKRTDAQSIRVGIDKIDDLINMVGELVITQSMLKQIGENFEIDHLETLRDKLSLLERNTRELQESVMRIRMVPISFAFNRFPRLVHDLSQKLGKKIDLELQGEQTELDKTVMEKTSDPLVHLVRNGIDHGIETPEERVAAGKPETGILKLNAYHEGGNIVIEISDDGAGLNREKIVARALSQGLLSEAEADSIGEDGVADLIFHPGFSTADEVSDISGRGVGMDVVRRNMASIGGTIQLKSREGHGSIFTIRLPLTLAILDGQTIRVGRENFILPLVSICESIQVKSDDVNRIAGKAEVFRLRDEYLPIIRLYRIFDVVPQRTALSAGLIEVVESDRQKVGLFVDELLNQQQVVIKSLETNFKRVDGISGATILGDGTVALILDVAGLVRLSDDYGDRPGLDPSGSSPDKSDSDSVESAA